MFPLLDFLHNLKILTIDRAIVFCCQSFFFFYNEGQNWILVHDWTVDKKGYVFFVVVKICIYLMVPMEVNKLKMTHFQNKFKSKLSESNRNLNGCWMK